jgi:hypothetical protein
VLRRRGVLDGPIQLGEIDTKTFNDVMESSLSA